MVLQKNSWLWPAFLIVACITALRALTLALSNLDVFVDEAQYWFWGQNLDFGYYSKPPLAAWVIRLVTELANSESAFWLRFPTILFHGATALLLGASAFRLYGREPAIWVAASYVTLPIVAVGSALISTDTILAPFFAAALFFYLRLVDTRTLRDAALAGAMLGLAFMAKYAAIYFFIGAGLAAVFGPNYRISLRNLAALLVVFGGVIAPNIIWNLTHDLTTVQHTLDNVEWVRESEPASGINLTHFAEFLGAQVLAVGPVILFTMLMLIGKVSDQKIRALLLFSLPILALVSVQAILSRAYGNWAFAAYFAGVLVAVPWLWQNARRWLWISLVINSTVCVGLSVLTTFAEDIYLTREQPVMVRYTGRDETSNRIIALARQEGNLPIVALNRDILADLFYTGRDADIVVYSLANPGRPEHYYQQNFAFPEGFDQPVLYISKSGPLHCNGKRVRPLERIETADSAYYLDYYNAYVIAPECFEAMK